MRRYYYQCPEQFLNRCDDALIGIGISIGIDMDMNISTVHTMHKYTCCCGDDGGKRLFSNMLTTQWLSKGVPGTFCIDHFPILKRIRSWYIDY